MGIDNSDYASSCNDLANLYSDINQYDKAEPLYLEAKQIIEKVLGKEHLSYTINCNNLAILYKDLGQYEKAKTLYLEAMQIQEKNLLTGTADYAMSCNNLANLYKRMKSYQQAEPLFLKARQLWGETLGMEHPYYAMSCNNLANLYIDMNDYNKAEALHSEAIKLREKVLGKEHPDYAMSCNSIGALYGDMGEYQKALPFILKAQQIWEKWYGKENPNYLLSCKNLGNLFWMLGDFTKATAFFKEALNSQNAQIRKTFLFTSETEKQSYLMQMGTLNDKIFSFNHSDYFQNRQGFAYDVSLSNRNLVLSSSQQLRQAIYYANDTMLKNHYDVWMNDRTQLSFWYSKPIAARPTFLKDLEDQANSLEKELTRLLSGYKIQQQMKDLTWKNIQQSLLPNQAAIEFVEFNFFNGKRYTDSTFYIAILLRKDKAEPQHISLFEKKQLDSLLYSMTHESADETVTTLYKQNNTLCNLIWKPLEKHLVGINKVYFAPAGLLHRVSFAALPVNTKEVLSDKYQLVQLNTTASVVDQSTYEITTSDNIALYGGINYNADSTALKNAVVSYATAHDNRFLPEDLTRDNIWKELSGTQVEIDGIKKEASAKYAVSVFSGINATEESLKTLNGKASPTVLHIASHGFFFPDPKKDKRDEVQRSFETSGKVFKQSDNPLFRSGLLFSGANHAWQNKPVEGLEDGILTAYEVSNLYLPNTKLVVLSACETALGDIQGSEGVYGLQRAFKMAGVQNLVMSLWKVPDAETAEFMQRFYKNIFNKQSISDAFYHAQTTMKNKYRNDPYKWAAWVLVR